MSAKSGCDRKRNNESNEMTNYKTATTMANFINRDLGITYRAGLKPMSAFQLKQAEQFADLIDELVAKIGPMDAQRNGRPSYRWTNDSCWASMHVQTVAPSGYGANRQNRIRVEIISGGGQVTKTFSSWKQMAHKIATSWNEFVGLAIAADERKAAQKAARLSTAATMKRTFGAAYVNFKPHYSGAFQLDTPYPVKVTEEQAKAIAAILNG